MNEFVFIFLVILATTLVDGTAAAKNVKNIVDLPERKLSAAELVKYWGYPVEVHEVRTIDGYILTIHRIPHGKNNAHIPQNGRPVFFLQHGLLCSSADWVLNLPHQSLGFLLAEAGYDVWMGNVRGNTYSRKHTFKKLNSSAFWSFSFVEHVQYDLPAMIDHVLETTNQDQLYYVGHSMGNMMVFARFSDDIEFQSKIKIHFALAAPTRLANVIAPVRYLFLSAWEVQVVMDALGLHEFCPSRYFQKFNTMVCSRLPLVCALMVQLIQGYDLSHLNITRATVYGAHIPAGSSIKNLLYFGQLMKTKKFQKYDYGVGNWLRYFQEKPPEYYLGNIEVPTVLFYGSQDWFVPPADSKWISEHLPNVIGDFEIKDYNHIDFLIATNAHKEVYEKIIAYAQENEQRGL